DEDLAWIEQALSAPATADALITYHTERMLFYDCIQRAYTDNGHGGGRLTLAGIQMFVRFSDISDRRGPRSNPLLFVVAPVTVIMSAGRADVIREYDRLMDVADANLRLRLREAKWSSYDDGLVALRNSMFGKLRFMPILMFLPALNSSQVVAERY